MNLTITDRRGREKREIQVDEHQKRELPSGYQSLQTLQDNLFGNVRERLEPLASTQETVSHGDRMKMKKDPTIRFGSLLKKFAILGHGWEITPGGGSTDVANFVETNFSEWIKGTFSDKLRQILSAVDHGVSLTEIDWEVDDNRGVFIEDLKVRERELHMFELERDKHGNMVGLHQSIVNQDIPLDKVIIFTYLNQGSHVHGQGDLEAAWDSWYRKKAIKEFYSAFLELHSKINTIANFEGRNLDDEFASEVWKMLGNLQLGGRAILPEDIETEIIDMGRPEANSFFKAIKYFDTQMLKAVLTPQLVGEAGAEQTGVGSFALGEQHFNIFVLILKYLKQKLEDTVNDRLVRPLVDFNFDVDEYPRFRLKFFDSQIKILQVLIKLGVIKPDEEWVRDYFNLPGAEEKTAEGLDIPDEVQELKQHLTQASGHVFGGNNAS